MSGVLERAKAHFEGLERRRIEVPEWGDGKKPLVVTFAALTVGERRRIFKPDDKGRAPDGPTACVRAVILKACDEQGRRLFDEMDEHDLTHKVDSDVIGRIAGAILAGVDTIDDELVEQEKNA